MGWFASPPGVEKRITLTEKGDPPGVGAPGGPPKPERVSRTAAQVEVAAALSRQAPSVDAPTLLGVDVAGDTITLTARVPADVVAKRAAAIDQVAVEQAKAMAACVAAFRKDAAFLKIAKCRSDLAKGQALVTTKEARVAEAQELARAALELGEDPVPHEQAGRAAKMDLEAYQTRLPVLASLLEAAERAAEDAWSGVMRSKLSELAAEHAQKVAAAETKIAASLAAAFALTAPHYTPRIDATKFSDLPN